MAEPQEVAKTVVPASSATDLDSTLKAPSSGAASSVSRADTRRSTVLPHVEWTGEKPALLLQKRERFQELAPLGRGGMGEVVLIKDLDIDRAVALKRLPQEAGISDVLRFVDEIRTVGHLEHPNIVPVHDVGIDDQGRYFFLMKHLKGETLASIIERLRAGEAAAHQRYPFTVRQQIFLGILNAMAYAHGEGVIHRDLKPANIMVGPFGEVTVMDWGLAKHVGAPESSQPVPEGAPIPLRNEAKDASAREAFKTQAGATMGTPHYMSPEQARGEHDKIDARSDTYALSVIFHELMYLDHYLEDLDRIPEILQGVIERPPDVFTTHPHPGQALVPAESAWFIHKGMQKDPAQRYQSVQEMIEKMQRGFASRIVVQCHRTMIKRALQEVTRSVDSHPMLVTVGGVAVIALFVAAIVKSILVFL